MSTYFGVHLGNSSICLSVLRDGKVEVVANDAGDRVTPAVFAAIDDEIITGLSAKQQLVRNGALTIINNKQFLDEELTEEDFANAVKNCTCRITNNPIQYELTRGDDEPVTVFTPAEVASQLFTNIAEIANHNQLTDDKLSCVLSVPNHFSQTSRKKLAEAANDAGFCVMQVISESVASLLAYDIDNKNCESNVLVYRLGGTSCDVTLFNVSNGLYEIVDNVHKKNMGGKLITDILADYIAKEFYQKTKLDPRESRRVMIKLMQQAENLKHVLSTVQSAHIFVESLMDGIDWSQNLSRARFENLIQSHVSDFREPINELLMKNEGVKIEKIILCGGSMKIPKLQALLSSLFPDAEVMTNITPDEVIAIGCAKQASLLAKSWDPNFDHLSMEVEVLPYDLCLKVNGKPEEIVAFKKGSPVSSESKFKAKLSNDNELIVNLYEKHPNGETFDLQNVTLTHSREQKSKDVEFSVKLTLVGVDVSFV